MELKELRNQLDQTDKELLELVAKRQATIREIARLKQSTGFPLRDFRREREVLQLAASNAEQLGISGRVAKELMRLLIRYSLTSQEKAGIKAHRAGNDRRALVIGGAGKMGNWFAQFLDSQGFDVEIADTSDANSAFKRADWQKSDLAHDFIVVATPMSVTNAILHELAVRRPCGVVFDLASLKSPLRSGLQALRDAGVRATSLHPMFGPNVELLAGRRVVFVDTGDTDALTRARALFDPTMAEKVTLALDEHDRLMAYVLGLSHAVNIAFFTVLARSGVSASRLMEVAGTTFAAQFDVCRTVANENAELYYEIQTLNEYVVESLSALSASVELLTATVAAKDRAVFVELMEAGRNFAANRRNAEWRSGSQEAELAPTAP